MTTQLLQGDCRDILKTLPDQSVQTVITSPPYYGLRDYGVIDQIGLERNPAAYVAVLVGVFREVKRVLRDDGTLWLNLGDSYNSAPVGSFNGGGFKDSSAQSGGRDLSGVETSGVLNKLSASGLPPKNLLGIPWRVAFALQDDGWYLRSDIIWAKPNCMPESVTDRPTRSHEYLFLFAKSERYFYDAAAIAEPAIYVGDNRAERTDNTQEHGRNGDDSRKRTGKPTGLTRNRRTVWTIATRPYADAHFATFPEALVEPCILAGSKAGDTVLDPFAGSGTVLRVAQRFQRSAIGIELNPEYITLQEKRTNGVQVEMIDLL
jgi:DNA modification methylase